jgi:hypothetical protein
VSFSFGFVFIVAREGRSVVDPAMQHPEDDR